MGMYLNIESREGSLEGEGEHKFILYRSLEVGLYLIA